MGNISIYKLRLNRSNMEKEVYKAIIDDLIVQIRKLSQEKKTKEKEKMKEKESFVNVLEKARRSQDIAYVNKFNDQTIKTDSNSTAEFRCNHTCIGLHHINDVFESEARMASLFYDYDHLNMELLVGLIFKGSDLDVNGKIKKDAIPEKDMVRFYTGHVLTYSNGVLNGEKPKSKEARGYQGFINYNELVDAIEDEGLIFNGPKSFENLKERIMAGEIFDVSISANLAKKETGPVRKLN